MKRKIVVCGQRMEDWGDWTWEETLNPPAFHGYARGIMYMPFVSEKPTDRATRLAGEGLANLAADGATTRLACRTCGDTAPMGATYCIECGAKL
jgi:hypothetical protein